MADTFDPNRTVFDVNDRMRALDDRGERMAMYPQLPEGRCWDAEHFDLCKDPSNVWAPFTVIRNLLIEAGAREVRHSVIMDESERLRWIDYCDALAGTKGAEALQHAKEHGSGIVPFRLRKL